MRKRMHLRTYGCQMNVYDSERMAEAMDAAGYDLTDDVNDADLVVLNTCHIREKAAEKVYSELGRIRKIKDARAADGAETLVAVAGCVAQAEGEEMARRAPMVDLVVGPQSYHRLPELMAQARRDNRTIIETEFPDEDKFAALPARKPLDLKGAAERQRIRARTAFLTVQEGCDKFCTFCVVPYTRGAEFSRPVSAILDEAKRLVDAGVRELTLLGQNVNAYHGEGQDGGAASLATLLAALSEIPELARLRYTTSHPRDMSDELIAQHRDNPKVMPYLHLPFQAGADRMLAAMNRKHTGDEYREIVARIREARPDLALSTDIIVGFPGESDADFDATMAMVRDVTYAQAYSFKYSPRPGTPAANLDEQVPEDVKSARLAALQDLLNAQQLAFNQSCVGTTMPVLFERPGRHEGQLVGRSPWLQSVHAAGERSLLGQIVDVTITSGGPNSLAGTVASSQTRNDHMTAA
ncbi:MAG: tRNA (N6-isopentenyl adenosine(37)-C2)-methylthiotransferase MiaB [Pseudomonadota bacterium]